MLAPDALLASRCAQPLPHPDDDDQEKPVGAPLVWAQVVTAPAIGN